MQLHVTATLDDYGEWKSEFDDLGSLRAEYGGRSYQLLRATGSPNEVTVLIEFEDEESARNWVAYLEENEELSGAGMSDVEISYLELVEHEQLSVD